MTSQLISFRFTEREIEALQAHSKESESLNLTAQRLLRNSLGLSTDVDSVNSMSLDDRIESIIEEKMTHVVNGLNAKLSDFEGQLGKL